VGNLTLLPPGFTVRENSKCVGTKFRNGSFVDPSVFSNTREKDTAPKFHSNLIALLHVLGSLVFDMVYYVDFVIIAKIFIGCQKVNIGKIGQMHLVRNPKKVHDGYLLILSVVLKLRLLFQRYS